MDAVDELAWLRPSSLEEREKEPWSQPPKYLNDVKDLFMKTMEDLSKTTGEYLHNLPEMKPSKQALKKMIDAEPSSLSYKNEKGQLPVQRALWDKSSIAYIPLLAIEGVR